MFYQSILHKVVQMKESQSTHNTVIQLLHETTPLCPRAKAVCRIPSTRLNRDQESNLTQPLLSFFHSKKKEAVVLHKLHNVAKL